MKNPIWQQCCLCLGLLLFFSQCQKDALSSSQQDTPLTPSKSQPILVNGSTKSNELVQTQLGEVRLNPYTVENMTGAWNTLYPQHTVTTLPATDLYMKFEPSNLEELRALEEAIAAFDYTANAEEDNDPFLVDHPLDREVLVQGDYYQDPNSTPDVVPPHYGVVKPDFVVPAGITATVLEELVLAPNASFLTIEAHRRLGLDYVGENGEVIELCDPSCPNFPHCLSTNGGCSGGIQPLAPPCEPGWAHFPRCLRNASGVPGVPTTPPTFPTNACGCRISSDSKLPGGCVQVFDTQLDWQPVANVEILLVHWFKARRVFTGDGCWKMGTRFPHGFEGTLTWRNSQATIRHLRLDQPLHYGTILKQPLGLFIGGTYNDIQIRHDFEASNTNQNKAYWMASTSMNALYEYNDYASINHENIGQTPSQLDILITSANYNGAAAPMLGKLKHAGYAYLTEVDVTLGTGINIATTILAGAYIGLVSQATTHFINRHLAAYPPDVVLNYGAYTSAFTTDNIKSTMYHEYAHVGHYAGLPSNTRDAYWAANIDYIVANTTSGNNAPYGIQDGSVNSERCAIMEMWGYHIGYFFADKQYGLNYAASRNAPDATAAEGFRFIYLQLERFTPNSGDADAWIPEGLPFDLIDDTAHLANPYISDPINDQVQGFTNQQIFDAITNGTPETMNAFVNNIKVYNNSPLVDSLISEYNY